MAGIYIHIPFCKQACHYCNFHFSTSLEYKDRMLNAINQELILKSHILKEEVDTVYLGGGTPSLLTEVELNGLIDLIEEKFDLMPEPEITLEANPDDINNEFVRTIKYSAVNRLSIGIQSFFDVDLQYMNRAHSGEEAHQALRLCLNSGLENITADLIYGLPTLSETNWMENIDHMVHYGIPHVSCYQLTVEPQTPLHALIAQGKTEEPDDEKTVQQFYILMDKMEINDYEAYEISNFAKPGFRSRHNSSYWKGSHYIGVGPSAHSYIDNTRSWNTRVNKRYMEMIEAGEIPETKEELTRRDQYNEYILTRLRTMEGVSRKEIEQQYPEFLFGFDQVVSAYIKNKWITIDRNHYQLTRDGKIWTDKISSQLMA